MFLSLCVCKRFNQELLVERMGARSSLGATRDLLLNRVPVFVRQLHGRRDSYRVLALCGPRAWISHDCYFRGASEFASMSSDRARLANPRRACPFCRAAGAFTTPHVVAECRSAVLVQVRMDVLRPAFACLSVFQRYCIPDPALADPHGVWLALATGVSHPLLRWSHAKRWTVWQQSLYDRAAVYLRRVISESIQAFEELDSSLVASE